MHKRKRLTGLVLAACVAGGSLLQGCSVSEMPWVKYRAEKEQQKFDDMEERLFVEEITGDTLSLHFYLADPENYGIEDYEVTLGGYSIEHVEESYEEIRQIQEELHGMNYKLLTKEQQLTYEVLDYYLDTELNSEGFELYSNPLKPTIGQQVELPLMFADYMFYDRRDVEDYLELLSQIDDYYGYFI